MSRVINIYEPDADDFDSEGLGTLLPLDWEYRNKGIAGAVLTIKHPYDEGGKYRLIQAGRIIRADVPVRTVPEIQGGAMIATAEQWTVLSTATKAERRMYSKASGGKKKKTLPGGTEVTVVLKGENRYRIKTSRWGTGWIAPAGLDMKIRDVNYGSVAAVEAATPSVQVRPQLFRLQQPRRMERTIEVEALPIAYDAAGILTDPWTQEAVTGPQALARVLANAYMDTDLELYTDIGDSRTGYEKRNVNIIDALLNGEDSFVGRFGGDVLLDDNSITLLRAAGVDRGFYATYGRNLTGIDSYEISDDVVTAIVPVGEDKNGDPLYLEGQKYVTSPNYDQYPTPRMVELKVPEAKVGGKGKNKVTPAMARERMQAAVQAEWDKGVHIPVVTLTVRYAMLGDSEEYKAFKAIDQCHMYDIVHVWHPLVCGYLDMAVCEAVWNGMKERYTETTLGAPGGSLSTAKISAGSIMGGITGRQIAFGAVGAGQLASDCIDVRHIQAESINADAIQARAITAEKLAAGAVYTQALEAVQAHIQELVAGQITTDELYASMAQIASAQIGEADIDHASIKQLAAQVAEIAEAQIEHADIGTAQIDDAYIGTLAAALATIAHATIEEAQIHEALVDWAGIDNLTAQAAAIAKANVGSVTINSANIDWAAVGALAADVAEISQARIDQAAIDQATIARVSAEVADAITLTAHNANMDFATAQRLVASAMILEQGVGGSITIENLTATNAMFVQATLGRLTLKGTDGNYYDVTVTADGKIHTENLGYTDADIIGGLTPAGKPVVVNIAHIDELNAGNIKAQSAIITDIFTKALTAETISASEAFLASATIPQLYVTSLQAIGDALDLSANESIRLAVGNVQVGGRNLVLGSGIGKVVEVSGTGDRLVQIGALSGYGKGALYPVGTRFTVSFEAKSSRAGQRINGRYLRGATNTDFVYEGGEWIALGTAWQRYSYSGVITVGGAQQAVVYVEQGVAGDLVYIRNFQVETGTRATDWGPAPEDAPIAGRNLATGTGVQKAVAPQGTNNWCSPPFYTTSDFGMALLADRTIEAYSVSFDYAWTGADTAADGYALLRNSESSHGGVNAGTPMPIAVGSGSGHCAFTFTPTDDQREFGTTWMLSGMGTGNRDIQITVSNFKFEAGAQNTAWTAAPEDAQDTADDALASAQTLQGDVAALQAEADEAMEMLRSLSVGGANLIADSELITITGTDLESTSYVKLAEGLLPGTVYTLSMESAVRKAGSAAGMTLEIIRSPSTVFLTKTLDFSGGHQKYTFTTGQGDNTYEVRLYAGIKGAGNGRVVELRRAKLETGTFATMWTPANADIEAKLLALTSQLNVTQTGLTNTVRHIEQNVDGTIGSVESFFSFSGVDSNNPTLTIGTSVSPLTMKLTNSRLSFIWKNKTEVAYFSDNKLYVTNAEALERLSVGTSLNGHLDIVTTETGVGFLWR